MKKVLLALVVVALCGAMMAQGTPSSKATAAINTVVWCTYSSAGSASDT